MEKKIETFKSHYELVMDFKSQEYMNVWLEHFSRWIEKQDELYYQIFEKAVREIVEKVFEEKGKK